MDQIIYISLLDEGTSVYRPVMAEKISKDIYKIKSDFYDSKDEDWEFLPGSLVCVELKELSGQEVLVATKLF